jgi:stage II sporulation protein D
MISAAGKKVAALASARVEPASPGKSLGSYRVQVAALKDEGQAKGVAQRITLSTGEESDVVFDAKSDLYRVRVGRYASREEAAEKRAAVVATGLKSSWVVFEQKPAASPALKIIRGSDALIVPGQWLQISTTGHEGIQVLNGRYRGRILIYLNRRGRLNVINEIGFEDYLRGVIPREMGPNVYDNLDALKAQTIAARSYTVHNLGEFGGEGYDICSTPRCQVYGGMNAEHPLSDQAIAETAGEILAFDGEPVDALYSSTCGGHTEDVSVIFPKKNEAYLKGVPCLEAGVDRLSGGLAQGSPFPAGLTRRLIPAVEGSSASARLAARLEKVARLAGLPLPTDRLRSLDRREVQRFVASVFDLVLDSRLFVAPEDLPYLLDKPPSGWSQADLQLAAYLVKSGLLAGPLDQPLSESEIEETLFELALFLRVIEKRDVRYLGSEGEKLRVRFKGEEEILPIPEQLATYRRTRGGYYSSSLALLPGDRMTIFLVREQIIGVLHDVDSDGVAYDRTSNFSSWTRFRTDRQLRDLVDQRYPGLGFRGLSIVARGKSGRVAKMRLEGENGRKQLVEGLPVRWTLDVPDTWFTAKRLAPAGREPGWLFTGRGWGHGVGMCQVGAYGMGVRGHGYRDILQHYYTGVELVVGKPEPRRR